MAWTSAVLDLRTLLSDGETDRYHFRKRCFGELNSVNTRFKTFEFRRLTNFTTTAGVFKNGVLLATTAISSDSPVTGEFILVAAPVDGDIIEASYYTQWFTDAELQGFLTDASYWALSTSTYDLTPNGLIPAVKKYAAAEAYLKMAIRWKSYMSSMYKVEDAPHPDDDARTDSYTSMSETFRKEALSARGEYYTRQDRNKQPLFGTVIGRVPNLP